MRIIGTLRQFQDKIEISGYHFEPVTSFNEITIHYLSCIQSYLFFKKRSSPATLTSGMMNTSDSDDLETKVLIFYMLLTQILKYIRSNQQQNGSSTSQFDLMQRFEGQGYDRSAVE